MFVHRPMLMYWNDLLWKRLPSDIRLVALDEIEEELIVVREQKQMQYLHEKVLESTCVCVCVSTCVWELDTFENTK
jgi:hypothetical protein